MFAAPRAFWMFKAVFQVPKVHILNGGFTKWHQQEKRPIAQGKEDGGRDGSGVVQRIGRQKALDKEYEFKMCRKRVMEFEDIERMINEE